MPELTADDMTEYEVVLATGQHTDVRRFAAAYVAANDVSSPGMLVFKDHQHRVVAMVNAQTVLTVERKDEPMQIGVPLVSLPKGMVATDGQLADLQALIDAAVHPRKVELLQNFQHTELQSASN